MTDNNGRFVWYELITTNTVSARAFYSKVMGWKLQDASTPEFAYTLFSAGDSPVGGLMDLPAEGTKRAPSRDG